MLSTRHRCVWQARAKAAQRPEQVIRTTLKSVPELTASPPRAINAFIESDDLPNRDDPDVENESQTSGSEYGLAL